ncbi:MAG TPA: S1/P1 nuclease [Thermoanaerobaculia bacterium]
MRPRRDLLAVGVFAGLTVLSPAQAWDPVGHQAVAWIAWERMPEATRAKAVALLKAAPGDADLASLLPASGTQPLALRERTLFARAAAWPDIVRDEGFRERRARYHHGTWHYIDRYWEKPGPDRGPRERLDLPVGRENVVERLRVLSAALADPARPAREKAIDLAWVLHLTGDVHQPLHTASRVTPTEPAGDRGGNLFPLAGEADELHWYWDSAITRAYGRRSWESETVWVARVATTLAGRNPPHLFAGRLAPRAFETWAQEGYRICTTLVYPETLRRGQRPPARYRWTVRRVAEPAMALAGYRLAALLEAALGR